MTRPLAAFLCCFLLAAVFSAQAHTPAEFVEKEQKSYNPFRITRPYYDKKALPEVPSASSSASAAASDEDALDQKNWSDEADACPNDMYLKDKKCRPCSECGPDLYVRQECTTRQDTVCDWCLNPKPTKNEDFEHKCLDIVALQKEFQSALGQRQRHAKNNADAVIKPIYAEVQPDPDHYSRFSLNASYKLEMIMEACLYLALIALIFVVIRFISKSKPYYRTVTINPPILDEQDSKNIIRAADQIREKLGKKGYERLEEFI
jgi:hypothetical protein